MNAGKSFYCKAYEPLSTHRIICNFFGPLTLAVSSFPSSLPITQPLAIVAVMIEIGSNWVRRINLYTHSNITLSSNESIRIKALRRNFYSSYSIEITSATKNVIKSIDTGKKKLWSLFIRTI